MILEIDFIPKSSPAARGIKPVRPIWMDVRNGQIYPVFNVQKGSGEKGEYTYPNDEPAAYRGGTSATSGWPIATACSSRPRATCTRAAYHTDLWVRRAGRQGRQARLRQQELVQGAQACKASAPRGYGSNAHLFRSDAKYFEPAGAVSWDVAMTGTPAGLEGEDQQGRHALDQRHLRHQARRLVGVDGDHGRLHGRRRVGQEPLQASASTTPASRPTATCARTATTAAASPTCPIRASCPTGRRSAAARSTSSTSSTRSATSASPAQAKNPPVIAAGPVGHVPQPGGRQAPLPLDHVLQGALYRQDRASPTRWRTRRSSSTRTRSASASRRPARTSGRPRPT